MVYQTTIKKGQITIPKKNKGIFEIEEEKRLDIELEKKEERIIVKPADDILDLAETFKAQNKELSQKQLPN